MDVRPLRDEREWRESAAASADATFFHTPDWFAAFHAGEPGWQTDTLRFAFADGTRAIFPAVSRRLSLTRRLLLSGPAGVYGGPVATTSLDADKRQQIVAYLLGLRHDLVWRINPYAGVPDGLPAAALQADQTQVIDLEPGFAEIFRSWSKGHHAAVGQAARNGVVVRRGDKTADWRGYYACYQDSLRRWGAAATSRYRWELFAALAALPADRVTLWLAEREGRLLAGAVCFCHRRHTVYWHGAAFADALKLRPATLLVHDIVRDACARGGKWFDFNPSGGHDGVERFKHGFAPACLESPILRLRKT